MRRVLKVIGWTVGALVVLLGLAVAGVYLFVSSSFLRSQIEHRADAMSGRKTTIAHLSIDWGWISRVHIDGVTVSNSDWAKADHMFAADEIEFEIRLWPLLRGNIELPSLILHKPQVALESNAQDQSNWSFSESPAANTAVQAVQPKQRTQMPLIGRLEIDDGHVSYTDTKRKLQLDGTVQTATGKAGEEPSAELALKGSIEKQPLTVHFLGGSALMLRDTKTPYPVDLNVVYGDTKLLVKGTLDDPFEFKGANVQLSLSGSDLSDIFPLLGIPGPPTPPYRLTGKLNYEPGIWHLDNVTWHAGDSDLAGNIAIDGREKPSRLTARLTSQHLSFKDLAPLVGATPGKTGNVSAEQKREAAQLDAKGELFPDIPLHVERLRAMNMDVSLDAKHVVAPNYLPVQALAARVKIENGQALVQPFTMAFGGGKIAGELALDARADDPTARANLQVDNVQFGDFFRGSRYFDTTKGLLDGHIRLVGQGRSLARVMGTADGDIALAMGGGSISSLIVSLADLQIGDALALYITGDNQIPISCAVTRLNFAHGVVVLDRTLIDTRKSVLHFDGQATLKSQAIETKITAGPKQFDLLRLHAPIVISGKLGAPKISLGGNIPLLLPDLGNVSDVDCNGLIREMLTAK